MFGGVEGYFLCRGGVCLMKCSGGLCSMQKTYEHCFVTMPVLIINKWVGPAALEFDISSVCYVWIILTYMS